MLELEQASTYVTLLQEVAVAANEASSLAEALQAALDCICSGTGWPVGHVYVPAHDGTGDVVPSDLWHVRDDSFEPFQRATAATRLPLGVGLPGKTMVTQRPEWITVADCNERTFPRRPAAEAVGIESGLATPVLADGEVAAVLEFFSVTARQPDAALLEVLGAVGRQLGRVCERKRADQELERLAAIVDSSGDAIVGLGIDGTVANWNAAAEALTGFGSTEMIGRHIARVIATERRGDLVDILAKLEGGEPVLNFETSLTTKAGKAADVWLSVSLIVDAAGMPTGISATVRDVTARMEAERRLRETESRYRTLVEQLPLAVYTYALDAEHRPLYRSPQIESMLGYSTDEWLADPHLFTKLLHPGDRDRVTASVQHADAHGEPFADEFRLIARDGRVVWVRDEHVTIRDEAGRPQHCQGYMLDVTAAKEAEERRRETEVRFRTLAEQLPLTTYIDAPDASGNTYVSPQIEAMSGYPSSDWLGDSSLFAKLLHPEDRDHVLAAIAESAEAAAPLSHEYRLIARDGRTVWLRDSAVTVPDSEGRPSYRQGYAVDITAAKEAEELLRQTEAKYRALVEQLPLATYVVEPGENWGTDGSPELERLVYISPQIERLVGYTAEEWISDPEIFWKTLHPDDVESVRAEHAVAFREHTPLALEYRLVHRDGRAVWIQDEMVMRRDEDGTPLYAQGYLLDVTERRSGEQRLREAEARFRTLVEQIPLAIYIDALDEHSSAIYMSPQIETMVGYSPEEWLADPELFPRLLHPDDRERVMAEVERTQSTGDAFRVEYRLIAKDGRSVWIRDEDVTIRDEDGTGLYAQGYMLDITERKASEERLRDSEERTRLLFDTALDAVVTMDASGTIIGWNAQSEATFGWSAEEAVGRRLADTIVPPEYRIAHERGLARFLATGKGTLLNQRIEITALHRDGQEFPVELAITPLERGGTYEFSAFLRDISERKRAEAERDRLLEAERAQTERLRELDRLKDEFVALVSHELRTPLTSIRGYLELVLEGETGPLTDDQARFLGVVERNAARLQHLVGDLLFIAQVEAGRLTLSW
ncbi:MAG: PAS domain S-box protein, partial [Gaiellaceae bacterium]